MVKAFPALLTCFRQGKLDKNKGAFVTATTADAIKRLVAEDEARKSIPRREIGFHVKEDAVPYRVRRRRLR